MSWDDRIDAVPNPKDGGGGGDGDASSVWQHQLPEEVLIRVLSHLLPRDVGRASMTCRAWHAAAYGEPRAPPLPSQPRQPRTGRSKLAENEVLRSFAHPSALWRFISLGSQHNDGQEVAPMPALLRFLADRSKVGFIEQVSLEGCTEVSDDFICGLVRTCPTLRRLNLAFCAGPTARSMFALADLHHLVVLSIRGQQRMGNNAISTALAHLPQLEFLDIGASLITDTVIEAIGTHLTSLKHLHLRDCPRITAITPLANCHSLVYLSLRKCTRVSPGDVHTVANALPALHVLDLRECWKVVPTFLVESLFASDILQMLMLPSLHLDIPPSFTLLSQRSGFRYIRVRPFMSPEHRRRGRAANTTGHGDTVRGTSTSRRAAVSAHTPPSSTPIALFSDGDDAVSGFVSDCIELYTYPLAFAPTPACNTPFWLAYSSQVYTSGRPSIAAVAPQSDDDDDDAGGDGVGEEMAKGQGHKQEGLEAEEGRTGEGLVGANMRHEAEGRELKRRKPS